MTEVNFGELPGVSREVAAALAERGIHTTFPIQRMVAPLAATGDDVLAQAPTGSGKTLAFGLPMLARIADDEGTDIAGLVMVPTRELAIQVRDDLQPYAEIMGLNIAVVYGGAGIQRQADDVANADIVVGTPGRLQDLLDRRQLHLGSVSTLVLDEADRMLDLGFAPQVKRIVKHVPNERQTLLFSATLDGAVAKVVDQYTRRDAHRVTIAPAADAGELIEHVFEETSVADKIPTLVRVIKEATDRDLTVVFVRTKHGADRLSRKLTRQHGLRSTAIHGGMSQGGRLRELENFKRGKADVLIATDVFARGIDLDNITHVIQYDPPHDADTYMHRIGRTGRAGRSGTGISLVTPDQLDDMLKIARQIGLVDDDGATPDSRTEQPKAQPRRRNRSRSRAKRVTA